MDAILAFCDTGAPSRFQRYLETGLYLQVLADAGMQAEGMLLLPWRDDSQHLQQVFAGKPRFVAFNVDEFNLAASVRTAASVKSALPGVVTCGFGIHTMLDPDQLMGSGRFDYLVIGEGEVAMYELLNHILQGADVSAVRNIWHRSPSGVLRNPLRPLHENLDTLPYANRCFFRLAPAETPASDKALYVSATRGCPYDCSFCHASVCQRPYEGKGAWYRLRSPHHVAGEILAELRHETYSRIVFCDEIFPADRNWLRQFGQRLGGSSPLPFEVTVACEQMDQETVTMLDGIGCRQIVLGMETGSETFRKRICSRNLSNDRARAVATAARERGMSVAVTCMLNLPGETEQLAAETCELVRVLAPDEVRSWCYQLVPSTRLSAVVSAQRGAAGPAAAPEDPSFTRPTHALGEMGADQLHTALCRLHLTGLAGALRSFPTQPGYCDLLNELPRARFNLPHIQSLEVGRTHVGNAASGCLRIEAGCDVRYGLNLLPHSVVRFHVCVPAASTDMLRHAAALMVIEIAWTDEAGEQVIFSRLVAPGRASGDGSWVRCMAALPEAGGAGELVLRVQLLSASQVRAFAFLAAPAINAEAGGGAGGVTAGPSAADLEGELARWKAELESVRRSEIQVRELCEEKTRRVAELHVKIIELEKTVEQQKQTIAELEKPRAAGPASKLKDLFRK